MQEAKLCLYMRLKTFYSCFGCQAEQFFKAKSYPVSTIIMVKDDQELTDLKKEINDLVEKFKVGCSLFKNDVFTYILP